jgi:hypothetical protein
MRTAPVAVVTQAEIELDRGAAMAAVPARSEDTSIVSDLREDIHTSGESSAETSSLYKRCTRKLDEKAR